MCNENETYPCDQCNFRSENEEEMREHIGSQHGNTDCENVIFKHKHENKSCSACPERLNERLKE